MPQPTVADLEENVDRHKMAAYLTVKKYKVPMRLTFPEMQRSACCMVMLLDREKEKWNHGMEISPCLLRHCQRISLPSDAPIS